MSEVMYANDRAIQDWLDKQEIREATMRYCRGVDRCDADLISSAYRPDAHDDHNVREFTGETVGVGIVKWIREIMELTNHQITTQVIELYGDTAACESYFTEVDIMKGGQRLHSIGRYIDRFEKRDEKWKIIDRRVVVEMTNLFSHPDPQFDAPTIARRDGSDPSYGVFERRR